eukprot:763195-Hanusia_phi.AAC.4
MAILSSIGFALDSQVQILSSTPGPRSPLHRPGYSTPLSELSRTVRYGSAQSPCRVFFQSGCSLGSG